MLRTSLEMLAKEGKGEDLRDLLLMCYVLPTTFTSDVLLKVGTLA